MEPKCSVDLMHFILALLFPLTAVHILSQRAPFLGLGQRVAFLGGDRKLPAFLTIPVNILVIHNGRTQRGQIISLRTDLLSDLYNRALLVTS